MTVGARVHTHTTCVIVTWTNLELNAQWQHKLFTIPIKTYLLTRLRGLWSLCLSHPDLCKGSYNGASGVSGVSGVSGP